MNPRAAINDLLPFQGSPFGQLGYFSKLPYNNLFLSFRLIRRSKALLLYRVVFVLSSTFFKFFILFFHSILLNKRREWDSNPRALADKRFSRPPRYDHFDISPSAAFRRSSALLCQRKMYSIIILSACQ